jgi:nucleotide-binding universal stress UspA family protein
VKKILAPNDLSANALNALRFGIELAYRTGAELHILHVFQITLKSPYKNIEQIIALEKKTEFEARTELLQLVSETFDEFSEEYRQHVQVITTVVLGSPLDQILATSEQENVDLIVMGAKGVDDYPDKMLGMTTSNVITHSLIPVMSVPLGVPHHQVKNLLYTTDLLKANPKVKARLKQLAVALRLSVHIVHMDTDFNKRGPDTEADIAFEKWVKELGLTDLHLHHADKAEIAKGLGEYVKEFNCDVLALSPQNRSIQSRFFQTNLLENLELLGQVPLLTVTEL